MPLAKLRNSTKPHVSSRFVAFSPRFKSFLMRIHIKNGFVSSRQMETLSPLLHAFFRTESMAPDQEAKRLFSCSERGVLSL